MGDSRADRAFIGSFTSAGGRGIVVAEVDAATGALTEAGGSDAVADPSYLAAGAGGTVLYAVSETSDGAVAAFDTAGPGLRPIGPPVPVAGDGPTHLALAQGRLLTANYGSGSVSVLGLGPDGAPRGTPFLLRHTGEGPDRDRQREPHAHQVLPDPSGRWVLGVDLGTDSVRVCALDPVSGELRVHRETALRPGSGPRHLVFHPGGRHVCVLGELDPAVTLCRWDAATGELEPVAEIPLVAEGAEGLAYPSELAVSPDGRRLWVAVRGQDTIAVLELDEGFEKGELVATVPCGGHWPRDLVLDPGGRRLYVANERSGDVTWFDLDPATGLPHRGGSLPVPAVSCVLFA
ncbi:lactonase family protein [Streptomyces sp. t39]|uniref:lactonase family protein n=1 Tax=Streptomyces sp. t39 TaxID=1828156 RepID=UPI0011CE072A|nr:lactonase family protein [Streptomyces sp. t39]TXS44593.1 lactonase family protein [Streptomyces sp. t39]